MDDRNRLLLCKVPPKPLPFVLFRIYNNSEKKKGNAKNNYNSALEEERQPDAISDTRQYVARN